MAEPPPPTLPREWPQPAEFEALRASVLNRIGVDIGMYRRQQIMRRLPGLLSRAHTTTCRQYAVRIDEDPGEGERFLKWLTINVSELFRNPDRWETLGRDILPGLLSRSRPLRAWSAGCANGAEPYTLAMILSDILPGRHWILATDLDPGVLEQSRRGAFAPNETRSAPDSIRQRYLDLDPERGCYRVRQELKEMITFRQSNMLTDRFEENLDLIICRNVTIYFEDHARTEVYRRFAASLRPGGVLFVGETERISKPVELGLYSPQPFFYVRQHSAAGME